MDSRQSFDDGKAGVPRDANTDITAYREGQAAQQNAAFDASQRRDTPKGVNWGQFLPKAEVNAVHFTLLLVSPVLFIVYPILGLLILAVFGACVFAARALPLPGPLEFIVGAIICIVSFFPGMALEKGFSQSNLYRWLRAIWRVLNAFCWTVLFASGADPRSAGPNALDRVTPGALLTAVVVAILVPLLFSRLDRVYFPNRKEEQRHAEQVAQGLGIKRPIGMRILFGLIWLIPTMVVLNLLVRLLVELTHSGPESVHAFYQKAGAIVEIGDIIVWFLLCLFGLLPGTGRYRKKPEKIPAVA